MRNILVVELWNIGDVVLTIPFLTQLKLMFPVSRTTLLARSHAREILAGMGLVDEFIDADMVDAERWLTHRPGAYDLGELRRFRRRLRAHEFDIAFQCRMHVREHAILAMSDAGRRVGYTFGYGDHILTDRIPADDPARHKVSDWMGLLEPFGGPVELNTPRLHVTSAESRWADEFLADRGVLPDDTIVGVHPGASLPAKRWPLERFGEVADALARQPNTRVINFVDPAGYGALLTGAPGAIEAQLGLRELIALVQRCTVLVCNDSGPMHVAGALGVPTVAVFDAGIAQWFSPLGDGHVAVTVSDAQARPSSDPPRSLANIPTSDVLNAVEQVLRPEQVPLK